MINFENQSEVSSHFEMGYLRILSMCLAMEMPSCVI